MKILTEFICTVLIASLTSCGWGDSANNESYENPSNTSNNASTVSTDSLKTNLNDGKVAQLSDSINGLRLSVDYVKVTLDDVQNKITTHDNEIQKIRESKAEKFFWILAILCVLSVFISIIAIIKSGKATSLDSRLDRHRKEIDNLKNEIQTIHYNNQSNLAVKNACKNIENKLSALETRIKNLEFSSKSAPINYPSSSCGNNSDILHPKEDVTKKSGYFGDIIGSSYFRELIISKNEQSFFNAKVSGQIAEFAPIEISVLKGNDNLRSGVEFVEGSVRLQDASSMTVESMGKAEKIGDKWIIKSKAKVKLS